MNTSAYSDPFYTKTNQEQITKAVRQAEEGHIIVKTMEELEAMEKGENTGYQKMGKKEN